MVSSERSEQVEPYGKTRTAHGSRETKGIEVGE